MAGGVAPLSHLLVVGLLFVYVTDMDTTGLAWVF